MAQFDPAMLPPRPVLIPDELRPMAAASGATGGRMSPTVAGMFLATVVHWLTQMGVSAELRVRDNGWTVDVSIPQHSDDVILP